MRTADFPLFLACTQWRNIGNAIVVVRDKEHRAPSPPTCFNTPSSSRVLGSCDTRVEGLDLLSTGLMGIGPSEGTCEPLPWPRSSTCTLFSISYRPLTITLHSGVDRCRFSSSFLHICVHQATG